MRLEVITRRDDLVIRRLVLEPGEAMPWHTDPCHRFSVVVRGEQLRIEFRDTGEQVAVRVHPGMTDWDVPEARVHRGVNAGAVLYEEVVIFFLDPPGIEPQPEPVAPPSRFASGLPQLTPETLRTTSVDNAEAREILRAQLQPYRNKSYRELAALIGQEPVVREVTAASGVAYQVEIEAIWDDRRDADVRVMGAIDDWGWRSLAPLGDGFIMAPDGSFVGEELASE